MATGPAPFFVLEDCFAERRQHSVGDIQCAKCPRDSEFPKSHRCGGLVHVEHIPYSYMGMPHGTAGYRCDHCGTQTPYYHSITVGPGGLPLGDWYTAKCTCGWSETSMQDSHDRERVEEAGAQHLARKARRKEDGRDT